MFSVKRLVNRHVLRSWRKNILKSNNPIRKTYSLRTFATYNWEDPLNFESRLSDDEKMIRDTGKSSNVEFS